MRIFTDFNLSNYNSYQIYAKCSKAYFPDNENDVIHILEKERDPIILGNGNNVILSKQKYDRSFVIFNNNYNRITFDGDIVEVESGAKMSDLSIKALERQLSCIEIFYDIPSSLGGAIVMNAGASGEEIKDIIIKVRYLDLKDKIIKEMLNDEIEFGYRNSIFQMCKNKIVLKAWLQLRKSNKNEISWKMETMKSQRWAKQPRDFPSAGSVFKRPKGIFVGQVIEELGLKGFSIGGAKISEKHAGFIINTGKATGKDIIEIINHTKIMVREHYNIDLEVEQQII